MAFLLGGKYQRFTIGNLAKMVRWHSPFELPKMATADNAELLGLSGPRSPSRQARVGQRGRTGRPTARRQQPAAKYQPDRKSPAEYPGHHEGRPGLQEHARRKLTNAVRED